MAKNKPDKSVKDLITLGQTLSTMVSGTDTGISNSIDRTLDQIGSSTQKLNGGLGGFSDQRVSMANFIKQDFKNSRFDVNSKRYADIVKMSMGTNSEEMFGMLKMEESDRFARYDDSAGVLYLIPELIAAFEIYSSNIINPDSFTNRDMFLTEYLGYDPDSQVRNRLKFISTKYEFDGFVKHAVTQALSLGDHFALVTSLERSLRKKLAQLPDLKLEDFTDTYDPKSVELAREVIRETYGLNDSVLQEDTSPASSLIEQVIPNNSVENLDSMLLEHGGYGMELTNGIELESLWESSNEFKSDIDEIFSNFIRVSTKDELVSNMLVEQSDDVLSRFISGQSVEISSSENPKNSSASKTDKSQDNLEPNDNMPGSVLKHLNPHQVIKLWSNGICHGYLYYEEDESYGASGSADIPSAYSLGNLDVGATNRIRQMLNRGMHKSTEANPVKNAFIVNLFGSILGKKIDKARLMNSPDYASFIHTMLDKFLLRKKRIRVTFLEPTEVEHFAPNMNTEDGYGRSMFNRVMFYAKLLLALITNTLLWNIKVNREHNMWYINVGEDENEEEVVNEFIASIKGKEVSTENFQNIQQVLADTGYMQDLIWPTRDGNKTVERESMRGGEGDKSIQNNELIEYLIKAILSAVVIPPALTGMDDVEYARTLAMQNGRFLRKIVDYQFMFEPSCTRLLRRLYQNEYHSEDWKKDMRQHQFNLSIYLKYPEVHSYLAGIFGTSRPSKTYNPKTRKLASEKKVSKDKTKDTKSNELENLRNTEIEVLPHLIFCRFNQPVQLGMQMLAESSRNYTDWIEQIVGYIYGQSPPTEKESEVTRFKLGLAKHHMPFADWDTYEEIRDSAEIDDNIDKKGGVGGDSGGGGGFM